MNEYIEKVYESEYVRTSTEILRTILDAKYKGLDVNRVMKNQLQYLT